MRYKAVFFDFDGTLMDTSEGVISSGIKAMESCGLEPVFVKPPMTFIGPPLKDCFKITFGIQDDELLERLCCKHREFYHEKGRFEAVFYPGILETIKEIRRRGLLVGMSTLKYEDLAIEMAEYFGISSLFDTITGLSKSNDSTKAGLLIKGCENLGVKPSEIVLVGDSSYDEEGARLAGCSFIGVDWGFGFTKGQPGLISEPKQILEELI